MAILSVITNTRSQKCVFYERSSLNATYELISAYEQGLDEVFHIKSTDSNKVNHEYQVSAVIWYGDIAYTHETKESGRIFIFAYKNGTMAIIDENRKIMGDRGTQLIKYVDSKLADDYLGYSGKVVSLHDLKEDMKDERAAAFGTSNSDFMRRLENEMHGRALDLDDSYLGGYEVVKNEMVKHDDVFQAQIGGGHLSLIALTIVSFLLGLLIPAALVLAVVGAVLFVYSMISSNSGINYIRNSTPFLREMEAVTRKYFANLGVDLKGKRLSGSGGNNLYSHLDKLMQENLDE